MKALYDSVSQSTQQESGHLFYAFVGRVKTYMWNEAENRFVVPVGSGGIGPCEGRGAHFAGECWLVVGG